MSTGYLGPEGSYSQTAAEQFGMGEPKAYPSFYALFAALGRGEVSGIVLPVENSLNGGVMRNLDLLQEAEGIIAVRELNLKIDHRLVTLKGADLSKIDTIYSHPQALGQCAKYIEEHFPNARTVPAPSTSACLGMIKSPSDAGITGSRKMDERFELSNDSISDYPENYTQFLYVVKGTADGVKSSRKIFLSVTCAHKPGALVSALSVFAGEGINLTRIESRPIKTRLGEYVFFIEVTADYASPKTRSVLCSLRDICSSIKILGCY